MKKIIVQLRERSYPICIGDSFKGLGTAVRAFSQRVLIVTHPSLKKRFGKAIVQGFLGGGVQVYFAFVPEGEQSKNLVTVQRLYKECLKNKLDRSSCVVALGGGVVGDIAGFVASTYLRGVSLAHIPTTLLAMVDSSIGGKTGVDLPEAKNFVGSFYQPRLVWIDVNALKTLPDREFRNGLAEVIKYGVIADPKLFKLLEEHLPQVLARKSSLVTEVIVRCARIKADVVSKDEKETRGLREILNFGHTLGHAIETVTAYRSYKHGEAISIGMCAAGLMAEKQGLWNSTERERMETLLNLAGLPVRLKKRLPGKEIMRPLARDKKNRIGTLRFVLPKKIGRVIVQKVSADLVHQGLNYVQP